MVMSEKQKTPQELWGINSDISWQWHLTHCGAYMQHNYFMHYLVDVIMKENPQINSIVELGTAYGAFTITLGEWGVLNSIPVMTIDINSAKSDPIKNILDVLGVVRFTADQFSGDTCNKISEFIGTKPTLFICDGAVKDWEVNTWTPMVSVGSIICGHDLHTELHLPQVKEVTDRYCIEFHPELWTKLNVQFAMWKKVRE